MLPEKPLLQLQPLATLVPAALAGQAAAWLFKAIWTVLAVETLKTFLPLTNVPCRGVANTSVPGDTWVIVLISVLIRILSPTAKISEFCTDRDVLPLAAGAAKAVNADCT
jgi:hypothetical protein